MTTKYPEHERLRAVALKSQTVGEFLDWLSHQKGISFTVQHEHTDACSEPGDRYNRCGYRDGDYAPSGATTRSLLAEFFEIDERKIEEEKRAMLAELRGESVAQEAWAARMVESAERASG